MYKSVTLVLVVLTLFCGGCKQNQTQQIVAKTNDNTVVASNTAAEIPTHFYGLAIGFYRGNQNPASGPHPTIEEMEPDVKQAVTVAHTLRFRVYSPMRNQAQAPKIIHKYNGKCVMGCWIDKCLECNDKEIEALIKVANEGFVESVVVGNEVLLREDLSEQDLIKYIRRVKAQVKVPVTYADSWHIFSEHPDIVKELDYLMIHIHPYWGQMPIEDAAKSVIETYDKTCKTFPDKKVVIGETGWPKSGEKNGQAVPSLENHIRFVTEFVKMANARKIPYFYFEAYDEEWKVVQEGGVGSQWGLWFLKREASMKPPLVNQFPFIVYADFEIDNPHFIPSGWMGRTDNIKFEPDCTQNPHSGKHCTKIVYSHKGYGEQWAGIYWQYPENNWGDLPGYEFKGVKRLTFWARGENGTEKSEFKVGGIYSEGKKYHDSLLDVLTTRVITLPKEWKKYTITIPKSNLDCVISGFCWVTNEFQNRKGATIYLDDIQFE